MKTVPNITSVVILVALALLAGCRKEPAHAEEDVKEAPDLTGKKIYYASSYHNDYIGHVVPREAFLKTIEGKNLDVRFDYLDAKKVNKDELLKAKALKMKESIDVWKPDLIIAEHDAVNKYLIVPYYRNKKIPVVFIGINWDASEYGYPADNVTGQVEVEMIDQLIGQLQKHANGNRVGILTGNTLTDQKNVKYYKRMLKDRLVTAKLVSSFDEWKKSFLEMQRSVDILILRQKSGIQNWDDKKAADFAVKNTRIPTGSVHDYFRELCLLTFPKDEGEFGEYAATTAIKILEGASPKDMPLTCNRHSKIYLNMALSRKLNIKFAKELIHMAHLSGTDMKKVLIINSYHKGYEWSDDIEAGILKALDLKYNQGDNSYRAPKITARIHRMDTKINQAPDFIESAALKAKKMIEQWRPDVVIATDDNASKYIISPYLRNGNIACVFCGLNADIKDYGFPCDNVTGITERTDYAAIIASLEQYAKGKRIGVLRADNVSSGFEVENLRRAIGDRLVLDKPAKNFEEWKTDYLTMQKSVDILILFSQVGIENWNDQEAEEFVLKNTRIPTGSGLTTLKKLCLVSYLKLGEEQGWIAGKMAMEILNGKSPKEIPVATNKQRAIYLNMKLAKKLGITFPIELLNKAILLTDQR